MKSVEITKQWYEDVKNVVKFENVEFDGDMVYCDIAPADETTFSLESHKLGWQEIEEFHNIAEDIETAINLLKNVAEFVLINPEYIAKNFVSSRIAEMTQIEEMIDVLEDIKEDIKF